MTKARDTASLVSSQTGIAVTISGDPVILGVGNTQHVAIQGSGRVGIGTVIAGGNFDVYKLEVYGEANNVLSGSIRANNSSVLPAAAAYVSVNSGSGTSGAGGGWAAWNHNHSAPNSLAGYAGNIAFSNSKGLVLAAGTAGQHIKILNNNYVETARFTSDNKVGIGTTLPDSPLHIMTGSGEVIVSEVTVDQGANYIRFKSPGGNTAFVGHGNDTSDLLDFWNYKNDGIRLGTNNIERVRVTSGGAVGIGTTNPDTKLTINDNVSQVGYSTYVNGAYSNIALYNNGGDAYLSLLNNDRSSAGAGNLVNNGAFIGFSGKYSSTFLDSFRTYGAVGGFKENNINDNQSGYLALYSRPSSGNILERVRVTSGGAVGIGTTNASNYALAVYKTENSNDGSIMVSGPLYSYIGYRLNSSTTENWFSGNVGAGSDNTFTIRYGSGPANSTGALYLTKNNVVSVGSGVTTGTANQTFQVMNGGGYFASHLSIGVTANYQTFSLYGNQWMNGNTYITWNQGDVIVQGLTVSSGYGISISSYNATMNRMVPSIVSSGVNKCVGINTTATTSAFGLVVQKENALVYETGLTGAIYARGSIYCFAGQYLGGLGAMGTSGTTDWNDAMNARSGNGYVLLLGNATNGPTGVGNYYHAINFEYSSKDGSGNLTQLAIPYYGAGYDVYYRTRYAGTWSSWTAV